MAGTMSRGRIVRAALATALGSWLTITACGEQFQLFASNLEIAPNPAVPGDVVVASFVFGVAPLQRHTIVVTIDDREHARLTSNDAPAQPYLIVLGDAADLIATYGTGSHSARVEVHAEEADRRAATRSVGFELLQASPQESVQRAR